MSEQIKYTLIENGLDFLSSSIEGLPLDKTKPSLAKRKLKYSILHLSAALELFFKKRLEKENWVYVFADMNQATKSNYENRNFKSADLETAIQRLEKIVGIGLSDNDKKVLNHFKNKRNKLEHYDYEDTITALENDIISVVQIVVKFISSNLLDTINTKNDEETLDSIKTRLIDLGQYTNELEDLAKKQLVNDGVLETEIIECPHCLGEFLALAPNKKGVHYCYYCNWVPKCDSEYKEIAESFIEKNIGSIHKMCKDGAGVPLYECYECGSETLVIHGEICHCFNCGEDFDGVDWCTYCGRPMPSVGEGDLMMCAECCDHMMSKD